ncbi:hypothetical protein DFH09DRAFT_1089025 [Mycena vulgaris]|nr:hypothetical protein DFH09DRAFT_1089025 [Mycena vulgaris]
MSLSSHAPNYVAPRVDDHVVHGSPAVGIFLPSGATLLPALMGRPRSLSFGQPTTSSDSTEAFSNSGADLLPAFAPSTCALPRSPSPPLFPASPTFSMSSLHEPPSPTTTLVGSQWSLSPTKSMGETTNTASHPLEKTSTALSTSATKRKATQADLADSPRRSKRLANARGVPGGGDEGCTDDGDYVEARSRRSRREPGRDCPRGGDAKRVTKAAARNPIAKSVRLMQAQLLREEEDDEGGDNASGKKGKSKKGSGGKKSKTEKGVIWTTEGEPPNATREPALRIVGLSLIAISLDLQHKLADFIIAMRNISSSRLPQQTPPSDFSAAMTRCAELEGLQVKNDFDLMMSYIRAAFYIQWRTKVYTGARPPSYFTLANEVPHRSVTSVAIQNWYKAGTCLIYLAAATSMYVIPMIAISGLKRQICKEDNLEVIQRMAYLLCAPHLQAEDHKHVLSKDCGVLTRTLMVPQMVFIQQVTTQLDDVFSLDFPPHAEIEAETILFKDVDHCVAEEITIRTQLDLKATPCPVNPENSVSWTNAERPKAAAAPVAFQELYQGGVRRPDGYVCIPSEICDGNVLTLRDANDELIAMLITNISKTLPHLDATAIPIMSAVLTGEVYPVNSDQPDFKYCASHKVYWNRYAEQGHDAPKDVHPNVVHKVGVEHIIFSQRAPHPSEEMTADPPETDLLAEFIKLVTIIIEFHMRKLLPKEHADISVYATRLPLNERSLAHPFGGFVINVRVSTRGHRDGGDKLFCVVIPFGNWTGGELVMYEPGCVFRPRPWDAIIFPSCQITHFNLTFEGVRLSLVLHSDKYGDGWVQDQNGWASRNVS